MKEFKGIPFSFDDDDFVLDKEGEIVACAMTMDSEQDASLAQLFAAAPELLEALQNMIGAFDNPIVRRKLPSDFNSEAIQSARAAIAKALGETK